MTTLNPIADAVEGLVSSTIGPLFTRLIDLIPDPIEKAKQAALIQQQLTAADNAILAQQNAINLTEASNSNLFVSGWRPFVGWTCAGGLAWQVVISPLVTFAVNICGYYPALPTLDSSYISTLLIPLLGLGGMRMVERLNGVARTQ